MGAASSYYSPCTVCFERSVDGSHERRQAFSNLKYRTLIKNFEGLEGTPFVHLEHVNITYNREWQKHEVHKLWFEAFAAALDSRTDSILQRLHDNKGKQVGLHWANFGHQQFHLPIEDAKNAGSDIFKGVFGLEWPSDDFEELKSRLNKLIPKKFQVCRERNVRPVTPTNVDNQLRDLLLNVTDVEIEAAFEFTFGGCRFRVHTREIPTDQPHGSFIGPAQWLDRNVVKPQPGSVSRGLGLRYVECHVPVSVGGAYKVGLFYERAFGVSMIHEEDGVVDLMVGHHKNPQFLRFVTKYLHFIHTYNNL